MFLLDLIYPSNFFKVKIMRIAQNIHHDDI